MWNASSSARWPTLITRRLGEPLEDEPHQVLLARRIERRGRLVHHDDVGPMDEQAREREPLLLAAGEDVLPARVLVEARDEVAEADVLERLARTTASSTSSGSGG